MRLDRERLQDVIECCEAISLYRQEIDSYHGLLQSRKDQDALLYELAKIGRLPPISLVQFKVKILI